MASSRWLARYSATGPGMLLIWDAGFSASNSYARSVSEALTFWLGVKSNTVLRPIRCLADGSYLAKVYPGESDRRRDMPV